MRFRIRRNCMVFSALISAVYWSMSIYIMAALYAAALVLVERNQLQMGSILM